MAGIELKTLLVAGLGGILPTFLWLWFWMKNDEEKPEPKRMIAVTYLVGLLGVLLMLPLQGILGNLPTTTTTTVIFAGIEELVKLILVGLVAFRATTIDEPTDYAVYLITGALGFSALENSLYLIAIVNQGDTASAILAGNMRFLGSTVLHTVTVAIIGIMIGLAFWKSKSSKILHGIIGLVFGIGLHTLFNYFILVDTGQSILTTFAGLWFVALIIIIIFQRLKDLGSQVPPDQSYVQEKTVTV